VYQHFRGIGNKDVWGGYREHQHPRAMLFAPRVGLSAPDEYRGHLDQLDLAGIVMAHMESTVLHVRLSGSAFTLDVSYTVTAR
jgi:hypothetical protein